MIIYPIASPGSPRCATEGPTRNQGAEILLVPINAGSQLA